MREIKFRGKRIDNGKWVYGYYFIEERDIEDGIIWRDIPQIQQRYGDHFQYFDVDPETIGQYTGLKDKNGKEIYEGDIVLATLKFFNINNKKCKIIFHNGSFGVQYGFSPDYFKPFSAWDEVEVIDNIYDNEMIKIENTDVASQIKYELMSKQ